MFLRRKRKSVEKGWLGVGGGRRFGTLANSFGGEEVGNVEHAKERREVERAFGERREEGRPGQILFSGALDRVHSLLTGGRPHSRSLPAAAASEDIATESPPVTDLESMDSERKKAVEGEVTQTRSSKERVQCEEVGEEDRCRKKENFRCEDRTDGRNSGGEGRERERTVNEGTDGRADGRCERECAETCGDSRTVLCV